MPTVAAFEHWRTLKLLINAGSRIDAAALIDAGSVIDTQTIRTQSPYKYTFNSA